MAIFNRGNNGEGRKISDRKDSLLRRLNENEHKTIKKEYKTELKSIARNEKLLRSRATVGDKYNEYTSPASSNPDKDDD